MRVTTYSGADWPVKADAEDGGTGRMWQQLCWQIRGMSRLGRVRVVNSIERIE
jgi:hypothetical protein